MSEQVVYAAPPVPPPVYVSPWTGIRHEWIGWDGSRWDLTDWRAGVFLTKEGVEGLGMPGETEWISPQSPVVHGQTYMGGVTNPRTIFWPVHLYSDESSEAWRNLDVAFWRTLQPGRYGIWRVTTSGGTREIRCRAADNSGISYEQDPHLAGWASYGIALVADDPFWYTPDPITRIWEQADGEQFYGGGPVTNPAPKAAPFSISKGSTLANAVLENPGDIDAWPVWKVTGPASAITLGVGGRNVTYAAALGAGETLVIDTDPMDQQAYRGTINVTSQLGEYNFARIPSGSGESLSLSITGTGTVQATIRPRFYKAW